MIHSKTYRDAVSDLELKMYSTLEWWTLCQVEKNGDKFSLDDYWYHITYCVCDQRILTPLWASRGYYCNSEIRKSLQLSFSTIDGTDRLPKCIVDIIADYRFYATANHLFWEDQCFKLVYEFLTKTWDYIYHHHNHYDPRNFKYEQLLTTFKDIDDRMITLGLKEEGFDFACLKFDYCCLKCIGRGY